MFADRFKDVVSWPRKLVVSRSGQSSREVPAPPGPGHGRRSITPDVDLESSGSDEKQVSLARMGVGKISPLNSRKPMET